MPSTSSSTPSRKANNPAPAPSPRVIANFALTWDARISTRRRAPVDFSSAKDKRRLLEIRAQGDALLLGKTTVETENIPMGLPARDLRDARVRRGQPPCPLRVIVTNSGRLDPSLKVFQNNASPLLIYSTARMPKRLQTALGQTATLHLTDTRSVDLAGMLQHLRKTYRVKTVVCEGGGELFRSLLALGLVDELRVTFCPRIFGGKDAPTLTGAPGEFLPRGIRCRLLKMEVLGEECFARYRVEK